MQVGISDTLKPSFEAYVRWIEKGRHGIDHLKLSPEWDNAAEIESCDALILTGGHDVDPALYGLEDPEQVARVRETNRARDDFEIRLIRQAIWLGLPILGICRGLQLLNVHFGGTLIPDLPAAGFDSHEKRDEADVAHEIIIEPDSLLARIIGGTSGRVNSSHHQAVDRVASQLRITARSSDGVAETLENVSDDLEPFILLVQWHPERMEDFDNPFSKNVLIQFLNEVKQSRHQRK